MRGAGHQRGWQRSRPTPSDSGVSLIEVVVAFSVLLVVLLPLTYLLTNEVQQAASAKNQLSALDIAEKWVEILGSAQDPPPTSGNLEVATGISAYPVQGGVSYPTQTEGNEVYHLSAEYNWTTADGTAPDLCTTNGGTEVLSLAVTVTWGANQSITDSTNLDYPAPGIPQYGFYRLQVQGDSSASDASGSAWSSRVQTIPVNLTDTATGAVLPTVHPDQYGCVFLELNPAPYSITVGPVTGGPGPTAFVENLATNGSATEPTTLGGAAVNSPVTISAGVTTTQTTVSFDEGSNFGLTYPTSTAAEDGVTCPGVGQFVCAATGEGSSSSLGGTPQAELTSASTVAGGSTWRSDATSSLTRFTSLACAGSTKCLAAGYRLVGATSTAVIDSYPPASGATVYTDTLPAGVTFISQLTCPTGGTVCTAIGSGTGGAVALATTVSAAGADTWTAVGLPASLVSLSQVACPSTAACVAIGSSTTGTGAAVSGPPAGPWGFGTGPNGTAISSLTKLACPSATTCMAAGTSGTAPLLLTGSGVGGAVTWAVDAVPAAVTGLTSLVCPGSGQCLETATTSSGVAILSSPPGSLASADTLPTGITALSTLVCPTSGVCVAIGTRTGGPLILSGTVSAAGPDTWSAQASVPSGDTSVNGVACGNATGCAVIATNGHNPDILWGSPGTAAAWTSVLPPSDSSALYLNGVACSASAPTTCTAVGATTTSEVLATGSSASTWSDHAADTGVKATGFPTTGIPIELSNSGITNASGSAGTWNPIPGSTTSTSVSNATSLTAIYPFANVTGVVAAQCPSEATAAGTAGQATVSTQPGVQLPPATLPSTLPLGMLALSVTNSSGAAEVGATLTLTSTAASPCAANLYPLQSPGLDGLSRTEVPFGSYTLTVTNTAGRVASTTVAVGAGTATVGSTTATLPSLAPVTGP